VGFGRLVTEITMGRVGLVGGIERSRLARSGADWYQLLELCALAGALLADAEASMTRWTTTTGRCWG
jgi:DNA invertase Pin-like site-specific DNA recombinase